MIWRRCILALFSGTVLLLDTGMSVAEESDNADTDAQKCINTRALRRTDVIDDRNIVFFTYGDVVYHNVLPKPCRGLSRERRFTYTLSARRLCNFDRIRVLEGTGNGIREGRSCKLGYFNPTTKEDIARFVEKLNAPPKARPPTLPEAEEVGTDPKDDENKPES